MGTFKTSTGERLKKSVIDNRIRKAKEEYISNFIAIHGYTYCERSKRSDLTLDVSHIISVDQCQKTGRAELAYHPDNMELLCRDEHRKIEDWSHQQRENWFKARAKQIPIEDFIIDWCNEY